MKGDVKGEKEGNIFGVGGSAALPGSLGGRSTQQSIPVHKPSLGFRGGGDRGITSIKEVNEGSAGGGFV